jgi:hypothetical protein
VIVRTVPPAEVGALHGGCVTDPSAALRDRRRRSLTACASCILIVFSAEMDPLPHFGATSATWERVRPPRDRGGKPSGQESLPHSLAAAGTPAGLREQFSRSWPGRAGGWAPLTGPHLFPTAPEAAVGCRPVSGARGDVVAPQRAGRRRAVGRQGRAQRAVWQGPVSCSPSWVLRPVRRLLLGYRELDGGRRAWVLVGRYGVWVTRRLGRSS